MNKETLRMQMLAGLITEGQYKQKLIENELALNENVFSGIFNKIKRFFKGETMDKVRTEDGLDIFKDDEGKEWIGVQNADYQYEPGYRQYWVSIYDMKDKEAIKKSMNNLKSKNKEFNRSVEDPHSGGGEFTGGFTKGDYFPEPVKVVNKKTF